MPANRIYIDLSVIAEDTDWGPEQDVESRTVINTVLDHESPQLVILNGDLITGEDTFLSNATDYVDEIVAPLVQRNLLWASTYGNHDSDYNLSRNAILDRERTYPNSLTTSMVLGKLAGVSNYYLAVYPSDASQSTPAVILWFFDSRGGNYYQELEGGSEVPQPCWVDQSVGREIRFPHKGDADPFIRWCHGSWKPMRISQRSMGE